MDNLELAALQRVVGSLSYSPLFVTVSGAHLYGFPSRDSDFDLRGAYVLPLAAVIGLDRRDETITRALQEDGREIDLVAHDIVKFCGLLLHKNGYVLEQLYSPIVVHGGPALDELRTIARGCITRHVYHHYHGFAHQQLKRLEAESPKRAKTLLYVYRVLLSGIFLLRTGQVEANLLHLNDTFHLPFIPDLITQKQQEATALAEADLAQHYEAIARLRGQLEMAFLESHLPEEPANRPALNDFVVRIRLGVPRG